MTSQTDRRLGKGIKVFEHIAIACLLVVSLGLTLSYRHQVESLRTALNVSCQQRLVQHNALHAEVGASVVYYREQLGLLDQTYSTQLKIIKSYPPSTQAAALRRLNGNRAALTDVLDKDEQAFAIGAVFTCAH